MVVSKRPPSILPPTETRSFVEWFRHCAPYIHAHRGRTFVVAFGGEAVADPEFHRLVHDLALLSSLGVRLVVVHGSRPQIEEQLKHAGVASEFHDGLHPFPDQMLFNLDDDPHEQHDVAADHPDIMREGDRRLTAWHAAQMQKLHADDPSAEDPLQIVLREGGPFHGSPTGPGRQPRSLEAYLQRLIDTGRADGAAALAAKYARKPD